VTRMPDVVALPKPSVVLFVNDVARMRAFYEQLASMLVVHDADDHAVLEISGMQVVIHALPQAVREQWPVATPPVVREDSYCKLCLPVASIAAARARAEALGGAIQSPSAEWTARGFRACDGHDPEGNVLQVRELAR
jgi:catechol 2,3-dioxygenase-like lactoylglutathione lyase family enzyme